MYSFIILTKHQKGIQLHLNVSSVTDRTEYQLYEEAESGPSQKSRPWESRVKQVKADGVS